MAVLAVCGLERGVSFDYFPSYLNIFIHLDVVTTSPILAFYQIFPFIPQSSSRDLYSYIYIHYILGYYQGILFVPSLPGSQHFWGAASCDRSLWTLYFTSIPYIFRILPVYPLCWGFLDYSLPERVGDYRSRCMWYSIFGFYKPYKIVSSLWSCPVIDSIKE